MKKKLFTAFILNAVSLFACTDFTVQTKDQAFINGRSMEFAEDLKSEVVIHPRGETITSEAPGNKKGLSWTSKYGYVGLNALGKDVTVDGLNEQGLSIGALWLPDSIYPVISENDASKVVALESFCSWILGNFKNIEEVKAALPEILIWAHPISWFQNSVPPLHFALHDSSGNNLVVELTNSKQQVYDNPIGVLTNNPPFEWHLNNLRNYTTVTAVDAPSIKLGNVEISPTGLGSGLFGIPGDWTPPSRFVRAAFFKTFANPPAKAEEGVNLAAHILNTVDIPYGDIKGSSTTQSGDYTQWVVIKDLKNKKLYFRDYNDLSLRFIDLNKLNFEAGKTYKSISVRGSNTPPTDLTP